jgi:hypothetical protein
MSPADFRLAGRLIAHTQPRIGTAALTPSAVDLSALGQRSSAIVDQAGNFARYGMDGVAGAGVRSGESVTLQAPRTITFPDGGRSPTARPTISTGGLA